LAASLFAVASRLNRVGSDVVGVLEPEAEVDVDPELMWIPVVGLRLERMPVEVLLNSAVVGASASSEDDCSA
jgi:hypothetical protein